MIGCRPAWAARAAKAATGAGRVAPVQTYLFGHSRADVVYDCR